VLPAEQVLIRFWADQYTLPSGACTNVHWSVQDVDAVYLVDSGFQEGVPGDGMRQVCPLGSKYMEIQAHRGDMMTSKILDLYEGQHELSAGEVIAQGVVEGVTFVEDLDAEPGSLAGWRVVINGLNPLYVQSDGCCGSSVTMRVLQGEVSGPLEDYIDWPIVAGQLVEFRAVCPNDSCQIDQSKPIFYLKKRSG
jgi:hypothetical protein